MSKAMDRDPCVALDSGLTQIRRAAQLGAPGGARVASCRACGASIVWAETQAGRAQPFDAAPQAKAVLAVDSEGRVFSSVVQVFTPHHATCPNWGKGNG